MFVWPVGALVPSPFDHGKLSCDMLAPLSGRLFDLAGGGARASVAVICRIVASKHIDA